MRHYANSRRGLPCQLCNNPEAISTMACRDCTQFPISCEECFISHHRLNPFHWAFQWDETKQFFVCKDISQLRGGTYSVSLGHFDQDCPHPGSRRLTTVVAPNGVHATRITYCNCAERSGIGDVEQAMDAQLFPGTSITPKTLFSFTMLRLFHLMSLEGKISAYDFMGAMCRLTDNAFTQKVPVSNHFALFSLCFERSFSESLRAFTFHCSGLSLNQDGDSARAAARH